MNTQWNLPPKRYYSIGEIAKAFGMNPSKIRFWEKEFEILSPKKNTKGARRYSPDDVKKIQMIYYLVEQRGHTLEGARIKLKEFSKANFGKYEAIERLQKIRNLLVQLKNEL